MRTEEAQLEQLKLAVLAEQAELRKRQLAGEPLDTARLRRLQRELQEATREYYFQLEDPEPLSLKGLTVEELLEVFQLLARKISACVMVHFPEGSPEQAVRNSRWSSLLVQQAAVRRELNTAKV